MYKVFINSNILFISQFPVLQAEGMRKIQYVPFENTKGLTQLIQTLEQNNDSPLVYNVFYDDLPLLWRKYRKHYELIRAGGGLVRNAKNKILFIYRHKRWDLPKGKAELGESIEDTSIREVMEECGVKHLYLIGFLCDTYHTYGVKSNRKLKKTSWFKMYTEDENILPQLEEDITQVRWFKEDKIHKVLNNTFPSILDVLDAELTIRSNPTQNKEWDFMNSFE